MDRPTFSSEALLRQAIANLLSRMPGVSDVQILHSQQEYGKDIIFWTKGPLGEHLPCACVVKNTDISGSADKGARAVCVQAEQALDTPFIDAMGQEQRIHRVYIISPGSISQPAMNSIRGRLAQRSGQLVFVSGDRLFELFRLYWLDFFVDEFNSLEIYLQQLEQRGQRKELFAVANIYGMEAPKDEEATIYVSRNLHQVINMFYFKPEAFLPMPDKARLCQSWRILEIQERVDALRYFSDSLDHLERWGLLSPGVISSLVQRLESFGKSLKSAWDRAISDKEDKDGPYEIDPPESLVAEAEALTMALLTALQPLSRTCGLSQSIINADLPPLQLLASADALAVCSMAECLKSAPAQLIEPATQRTFKVTELLVRESAMPLYIVGPAGSGKTSFCRWNALLDAQAYRSGASAVFPVYIPLQSLAQGKYKNFKDAFFRNVGNSALLSASDAIRIRLYLDGLDEVSSAEQRRNLVELARQASLADRSLQVIITARDYINAPWLSWLVKLYLGELDREAQEELLRRLLVNTPNLMAVFKAQIQKSRPLSELMKVPLLATLIILVFRQTRSLPENRARLYSDFVDLLSGGWDLAKGVLRSSRFGRVIKVIILSNLAYKAHRKGIRYFDSGLVGSAIRSILIDADRKVVLELTGELLVDGILSRSADKYFFSHLSFQEFLCAKQMHGLPTIGSLESIIRLYLGGNDWWREVIFFYISLSENPLALAEWLFKKLDREEGERSGEIWKTIEQTFPGFRVSSWLDSQLRLAKKPAWRREDY